MDSFWEPIIIENDELIQLKRLVHRRRQDLVNCGCAIVHEESKNNLNHKSEVALFAALDEKRRQLDNIERVLAVAEKYNYELMEKSKIALSEPEGRRFTIQAKDEESRQSIRAKKRKLQQWINDRDSKYTSEIEILRVIMQELGTIRNWLVDPDEY